MKQILHIRTLNAGKVRYTRKHMWAPMTQIAHTRTLNEGK